MAAVSSTSPRGTTIRVEAVFNFDQLAIGDATKIIYEQIVPACETGRVHLSSYGNHNSKFTALPLQKYHEKKAAQTLFNIENIQKAFAVIDQLYRPAEKFLTTKTSYHLRRELETRYSEMKIHNGEFIAAMLLKGYEACFGPDDGDMETQASFKISLNC